MTDTYPPSPSFQNGAYFKGLDEYEREYQRSIEDPESFWAEKAEDFHWYKKWGRSLLLQLRSERRAHLHPVVCRRQKPISSTTASIVISKDSVTGSP